MVKLPDDIKLLRKPRRDAGPPRTRGERNIDWIEKYLHVPIGMHAGKRMILQEYQREILLQVYDNPHGTRQLILTFGRKNAKTTLVSTLVLLHLAGPESIPNSHLYSTAHSKNQAAIVFDLCEKMIMMQPQLKMRVFPKTTKTLICPRRGTTYQALSSKDTTAVGTAPAFAIHDELGEIEAETHKLYDNIESGFGAYSNPLSIVISTSAPSDTALLSALIDKQKESPNPKVVLIEHTVPEDYEDIYTVKAIRMANPGFGTIMNPHEALDWMEKAKILPTWDNTYRHRILNQRISPVSSFIEKSAWNACPSTRAADSTSRIPAMYL